MRMEAETCEVATALVQACENGVATEVVGGVGKEMGWILLAELTGLVDILLEGCEGEERTRPEEWGQWQCCLPERNRWKGVRIDSGMLDMLSLMPFKHRFAQVLIRT